MASFENIVKKINEMGSEPLSIASIMLMLQEQLHDQFSHFLNIDEIVSLREEAQKKHSENKLLESKLLSRINPQTTALLPLNIRSLVEKHSYIETFPERANNFVSAGSVASIFSPAAYLTELYREALPIHEKQSAYYLGVRRPDISRTLLSQDNMDREISTLSYANEIIENAISSVMVDPPDKIEPILAECRQGGHLPYHHAYNTVRLGILQQDPQLLTIQSFPFFNQLFTAQQITALTLNLPPESFVILTETIDSEANIQSLYDKNFGDINESELSKVGQLANYYQLPTDEIAQLLEMTYQSCGGSEKEVEGHYTALFLLYFNKMVRLYSATELTIQEMECLVLNRELQIDKLNSDLVHQIAKAKAFSQQYHVSISDALLLSNAMLGMNSTAMHKSQFDLLFNTPLLDGQRYEVDGKSITVNPEKLFYAESFYRSVLKRTFKVDDTGLWLLHRMGCRNHADAFENTRENLSDLYRITLISQIYGLTIDELDILLQLSIYKNTPLYDLDTLKLQEIIQYISEVMSWLNEQNWTVYQLLIMISDSFSLIWTPALETLQQTLLNGLGTEPNLQGEALIIAMAPYFVSTLSLNSNTLSELCLKWVNQIKPRGQTTDKFWYLIQKSSLSAKEQSDVIAFTQTVSQLAMIINQTNISEEELGLVIKKPSLLISNLTELGLNIDVLRELTQLHQWVNGAGEFANDILSTLNEQQLTAELLAMSLQDDVERAGQAIMLARQVGHNDKREITSPVQTGSYLGHWDQVSIAIQLLKASQKLNITPDGIVQLLELSYEPSGRYTDWDLQSKLLLGALKHPDNQIVNYQLDEQWGNALSTYYRLKIAPIPLKNRNDVYHYLLIDNQISASVTTSRIAEIIASIQLYVYRALNELEVPTENAVLSRPFFNNWDKYNARYSTWAGFSQLIYYPENYLDPTMRIGQTQMMDTMLQDISQSNLNPDIIETAFNSYLSQFERIANLNIISGYHDNINFDSGLTYVIGHSIDSSDFYWRSVDQQQFSEEGKFPANAWREWSAIQTGVNAVQDWVRPFIFNSRLHVIWVEKEKQTDSNNQPVDSYILKISKLNYNGTWGLTNSFPIDSLLTHFSTVQPKQVGFYCSLYSNMVDGLQQDVITVIFYEKKERYVEDELSTTSGLFIYSDMTTKYMDSQDSKALALKVFHDFDTLKSQRLIKKIAQNNYLYNKSELNHSYIQYGYDDLTMVNGNGLTNINIIESEVGSITLSLDASLRVAYRGMGARQREQCNMMKKYYNHTPSEFVVYSQQTITGKPLYNVVQFVKKGALYQQNILLNNPSAADLYIYKSGLGGVSWPIPPSEEYFQLVYPWEGTTTVYSMEVSDSNNNKSKSTSNYLINTELRPQDVYVIITVGKIKKRFNASDYISAQPVFSLDEMLYHFGDLKVDIPISEFINNTLMVNVEGHAYSVDTRRLGIQHFSLKVERQNPSIDVISLNKTVGYAQYLQRDVHRIRINTLFAQQLITKANKGIDQVLTMDTQYLPEPQMGNGNYI